MGNWQDFKKIFDMATSEKSLGFIISELGDLIINSIVLFADHVRNVFA